MGFLRISISATLFAMYIYEYTKKAIALRWFYGMYVLFMLALSVYGFNSKEFSCFNVIGGVGLSGVFVYLLLFTTSLTVQVTSTEVQIICGIGYPKKSFSVEEILNVMQVQNRGFQRYGF